MRWPDKGPYFTRHMRPFATYHCCMPYSLYISVIKLYSRYRETREIGGGSKRWKNRFTSDIGRRDKMILFLRFFPGGLGNPGANKFTIPEGSELAYYLVILKEWRFSKVKKIVGPWLCKGLDRGIRKASRANSSILLPCINETFVFHT